MRSSSVLAKKQLSIKKHSSVVYGVCENCSAGCGVKAFMDGTAPVDFFGDEEHPVNKGSLCPKGLSLYTTPGHAKRLLTPCLRERPGDAWKPVGWDEALDALAQRLQALGEGAALALPSSSHDPFDYRMGAEWCALARPQTYGPAALTPCPLGSRGALAAMYGIPGAMLLMNAPRDWAISRVILVVGGDMAADSPVTFGPLEDARDRGNTLLYLGSSSGMTALRATGAMIVRPGTEAAALASIIHILLREKWVHEEFLAEYTDGIEELQRKVADLTPSCAARICGVDESQIEHFARLLGCKAPIQIQAAGPAAAFSDDATLSLCGALVALRGCVGNPGGGLNLGYASPFRTDTGLFDGKPAEPQRLDGLLAGGGCRAVIGFGNWAASIPGGEKNRAALKACKLVVHMGCFDDETRALAHISLPAAHWSEYASLVDGSASRAIQWRDALYAPAGQARSPLEIWSGIAARLGAPEAPWESFPGDTAQKRLANFALASLPLTRGITVDTLDRSGCGVSGGVQWPCENPGDAVFENSRFIKGTVRGQNILLAAASKWPGTASRFPTDNGRIRLAAAVVPSVEDATKAAPGKLRLVLAGQVLHAANHPATVRRNGLPLAGIHPETALKLSLSNGDTVRISGADASVKAAVRITWSTAPETVALEPDCGIALLPVGQDVPTTDVHVERTAK